MRDLQRHVRAFVRRHNLEADVRARILDLVAEVGEVAKEVLRGSEYGRQPFRPSRAFTDELGDVLFSLACLADAGGVELETALRRALAKYEGRIAARGDPASLRRPAPRCRPRW